MVMVVNSDQLQALKKKKMQDMNPQNDLIHLMVNFPFSIKLEAGCSSPALYGRARVGQFLLLWSEKENAIMKNVSM